MGQLWIVQKMARNTVQKIEKSEWISCRGRSVIGCVVSSFCLCFHLAFEDSIPQFPLKIHKFGLDPQTTHSKWLLHSCHHFWKKLPDNSRNKQSNSPWWPLPLLCQLCSEWLLSNWWKQASKVMRKWNLGGHQGHRKNFCFVFYLAFFHIHISETWVVLLTYLIVDFI